MRHIKNLRKATVLSAVFLLPFVLYHCKKPEQTIGSEVQPDGDDIGFNQVSDLEVQLQVVQADSLRTDELSQALVGGYNDPETGVFQSSAATHIRLSSANVDFGDPANLEVDSVILSLRYSGHYGDTLSPMAFDVLRLQDPIAVDSGYYSNDHFATGESLIKDGFQMPLHQPNTPLILGNDTLDPQLRIPLKKSFAEEVFALNPAGELSSSDEFIKYFPGIYLEPENSPNLALNFNWLSIDTKVEIFYRDLSANDTTSFEFLINANSGRVNIFDHDYEGSEVGNALAPMENKQKAWVRSGGSLAATIKLPDLDSLAGIEGMAVNQAEIILPVVQGTVTEDREPHEQLFIITLNDDGNVQVIPDQLQGESYYGGQYDETKGEYRFRISRWVQQVLSGERTNNGLRIIAGSAGVTANRTVLAGFENPLAKPKLVLTLTNF